MRRFLCALTFAAGLWLWPTPAQAGPWGEEKGDFEYLDPTWEEREEQKRAERKALIFVGLLALIIACAVTYQWGREIRDMSMSLFRRRRPVLVLHDWDELDELDDEYDDDDDF
jgi:hypothetical protein